MATATATSTATVSFSQTTCPKCGTTCRLREAETKIAELQAQVEVLTLRATSAVDKLADYEDELRQLKADSARRGPPTPPPTDSSAHRSSEPSAQRTSGGSGASSLFPTRLGATLFGTWKPSYTAATTQADPTPRPGSADNQKDGPVPSTTKQSPDAELTASLATERSAREAADRKVAQMSAEMEELSTQLFAQANEMVATERRARAKLEARVKLLEAREEDRRARLERLEGAVGRIEHVRRVLGMDGRAVEGALFGAP